jgi:hypothetical protein
VISLEQIRRGKMYIPDNNWDDLNTFCYDLVEQLEAMPEEIFFACKKEAIALCYIILNMQDKPINKEKKLPVINTYPYEAYINFREGYNLLRLKDVMDAFGEFILKKDIARWKDDREKIKFEIDLKKYFIDSIRLSKQVSSRNKIIS